MIADDGAPFTPSRDRDGTDANNQIRHDTLISRITKVEKLSKVLTANSKTCRMVNRKEHTLVCCTGLQILESDVINE